MSGTDKTRPFWVKVTDAYTAVHDHRNGACDIKDRKPDRDTIGWRPGACHFHDRWTEPDFRCGCGWCGVPRSERRQRRYAQRAIERSWWHEL